MLNLKLTGRLPTTVTGLLIFFVPFFTYLSPENLRQLSKFDILEIFLSLIIILIVIFISSLSFEILIKRFFKKFFFLFPLLCFAFYLNFLYTPYSVPLENFLYPNFGGTIFIFFELCCLALIAFGAKFYAFSIRMILVFSIFMLINAIIPLVSYLAENIGKNPTISYEIKSSSFAQDKILKKRNIYYIILDAMIPIEIAAQLNIATKNEVLDNLSNTGLKYIDKSQSSYNRSKLTLASIMLLDYHHTPSSQKYVDDSNLYPRMMYKMQTELPLISYLNKASSSFFWSGSTMATCQSSKKWSCINLTNDFSSRNSFKFYLTTPFPKIFEHFFNRPFESQDSIEKFLKYIDKNGVPKNPFFAFIHHGSPHDPFLLSEECESKNYFKRYFEGYKASYHCTLKKVKMFMDKINIIDPEAIVVFQGDHGASNGYFDTNEIAGYLIEAKIFNAIKAPEICFESNGLPRTNINTVRFALNCAYGFKLPYLKNIHYEGFDEDNPVYGSVVERKIYE
jgi:hypothetical protein